MKFLCLECDRAMDFQERQLPGDGTLAAVFRCATCGREMGLLTNPMETTLVSSLGVRIGGREVPEQPMELTRSSLAEGRPDAFGADGAEDEGSDPDGGAAARAGPPGAAGEAASAGAAAGAAGEADAPGATGGAAAGNRVTWSADATDRLGRVPSFVRGMVKRIYTDWAQERGVAVITPDVMDRARTELGLENM